MGRQPAEGMHPGGLSWRILVRKVFHGSAHHPCSAPPDMRKETDPPTRLAAVTAVP